MVQAARPFVGPVKWTTCNRGGGGGGGTAGTRTYHGWLGVGRDRAIWVTGALRRHAPSRQLMVVWLSAAPMSYDWLYDILRNSCRWIETVEYKLQAFQAFD